MLAHPILDRNGSASGRERSDSREANRPTCFVYQSFIPGGIMSSKTEIPAAMDYAGTGENRVRSEPTIRVELVVIDGPEGRKLHAIQAEVVYRILTRLAQRQVQTSEKESRL